MVFGVKGSGKSNVLALMVEQLSRFHLPQIILDTEREYQSLLSLLPRGVIATAERCPRGADILHHGLQVIVDLQSWNTDEAAAVAMCFLIQELFTATTAIAPADRVPCVLHLDEAGYWLPQEAVTYLSKETRKALADAFHKLASRGRKQGLTPFLYTQSISEIAKSAIRQIGVKVLMRQTLDIDLTRYCQYIQGATAQTKKAIQAYPRGKAIVILPDGSQHRVQFHARQSEHVSQTPQVLAALTKFAAIDLDVSTVPMRDLTASSSETKPSQKGETSKGGHSPAQRTAKERVQHFLSVDPTLRPTELAKLAECDQALASRARKAYMEAHPNGSVQTVQRTRPMGKMEQRIRALLTENPQYTPSQLAHRTRYSLNDVRDVLARMQGENVGVEERREVPEKQAPCKKTQPPLTQKARQRLEEAERRLTEQGGPITYDRLAHEAHIGYHAIATFLHEKR